METFCFCPPEKPLHAHIGEIGQAQFGQQVQAAPLGHPGVHPWNSPEQLEQLPGREPAVER